MFGLSSDSSTKGLQPAETPTLEQEVESTDASEREGFWVDRVVVERPGKSPETIFIPDEACNDRKLFKKAYVKLEAVDKKKEIGHREVAVQKSYADKAMKGAPVTPVARSLTDEIKVITRSRADVIKKAEFLGVNIDDLNAIQDSEIPKAKIKQLGNKLVPQLVVERTLFQAPGYNQISNNIKLYHLFITRVENAEVLLKGCQHFINTLKRLPDSEECFSPFEWLKDIARGNSKTQRPDPCAKFALCSAELSNADALEKHHLSAEYETVTDTTVRLSINQLQAPLIQA